MSAIRSLLGNIQQNSNTTLAHLRSVDIKLMFKSSSRCPGIWILCADVAEHPVCSIFIGLVNKTYKDGTDRVFRNVGT